MKAVLVTGGRDYDQYGTVCAELDAQRPDMLIHGGAAGADRLAARWAQNAYVPAALFPADWNRGPMAGPMRNAQMVRFALDLQRAGWEVVVVAFPGGKGTGNCKRLAHDQGLTVRVVAA